MPPITIPNIIPFHCPDLEPNFPFNATPTGPERNVNVMTMTMSLLVEEIENALWISLLVLGNDKWYIGNWTLSFSTMYYSIISGLKSVDIPHSLQPLSDGDGDDNL